MKKINYRNFMLIISLSILTLSCSFKINNEQNDDYQKLEFVNKVLNDPENILKYISESQFKTDFFYKYNSSDFINDNVIIIKKIREKGWFLICSKKFFSYNSQGQRNNHYHHQIKIFPKEGKFEGEILIFEWFLENENWNLRSIEMDPDHSCD